MIEIHFNWKSRAIGMEEAIQLAEERGASFENKECIVTFNELNDPNLRKILNLIETIKGNEFYVNGKEFTIREVLSILDCRRLCHGICERGLAGLWLSNFMSDFLKKAPLMVQTIDETGLEPVKTVEWYANFDLSALLLPDYLKKVSETEATEGTLETKFTFEREELRAEFFEETRLEAELCPKYDKNKMEERFNQLPEQMNIKRVTKIWDREYPYSF